MRVILFLLSVVFLSSIIGQEKKKIDVASYYLWKSVSDKMISDKGNVIVSKIDSYRGNDTLQIIFKSKVNDPIFIGRAAKPAIDHKERFVAYLIKNDYDSVRNLKLEEVNKKKWPKDSVAIYMVEKDTTYKFHTAKNYKIAEEGGPWVLIERDESFEIKKKAKKVKKCWLKKVEETKDPIKHKGSVLTVFDIDSQTSQDIEGVTEYDLNFKGNAYAYVKSFSVNDTIDSARLYVVNLDKSVNAFSLQGEIIKPTFNREGSLIAFKASADTGEYRRHQLYLYNISDASLSMVMDTVSELFPNYQSLDAESDIIFSRDGKKLFFNVGMKPLKPAKDTLTEDEKYKLDLWSWTDGKLQPQQLLSAKKDEKGLRDFVYHLEDKVTIPLMDSADVSLTYDNHREGEYGLMRVQRPYLKEMTWDFWYYDLYAVNLKTGDKNLIYKKYHGWSSFLSSNGKYLCFFEPADSNWYCKNLFSNEVKNLTKTLNEKFYKKNHDVAQKIGPEGQLYWLEGEESILIESQHDVWMFPLAGGAPERVTKGRENGVMYSFLEVLDSENLPSLTQGIYLKGVNDKTKEESISVWSKDGVVQLTSMDAKITFAKKAKNAGDVIFQFMNFETSPEIYLTDTTFKSKKQITQSNPQQEQYNWGTVELVDWVDYEGDSVRGLLYKPEDFDPQKKYPMIVYFYERYTDNLHYYYRPKVTASIIYATEYVSNGYIVFIPDIGYEIGKPAQGAYNAIMSGTDHLVRKNSFIDSTRMGLQGQSWGGYQTAQMITMTNRFKCGMAGAPVSNMFSAYGGMRWGSGLSRTFQYETGQSRIGATIWESPDLYVENSPLFHLPKVQTPLLIMHNDADGAVPWYQGVELFNGLRRLDKPVWLLNYNGDDHNLMKDANRMDLSIRMRQFFDHYLLGSEAPKWIKDGLPAISKGKETGYE
jgi:dipeptidyl aminopeptidase/acylaminoacyl peptidase